MKKTDNFQRTQILLLGNLENSGNILRYRKIGKTAPLRRKTPSSDLDKWNLE